MTVVVQTYPLNNLLNALFVTLHLQEGLNLRQRQVLPVSQGHQLIERAQQLKGIAQDFPLIEALANAGSHLGKKVQAIDVLENVGLAVGNKDNVELIQWLVHEAHVVLLDCCVLGSGVGQFGERSQESLNARTSNFPELT